MVGVDARYSNRDLSSRCIVPSHSLSREVLPKHLAQGSQHLLSLPLELLLKLRIVQTSLTGNSNQVTMARPVLIERKPLPPLKSSKVLASHAPVRVAGHKGSPSVLRPIKVAHQVPRTKQTISAAAIFKNGKIKATAKPEKHRKQRSLTPEEILEIDLSGCYHGKSMVQEFNSLLTMR
jgi:hypothetical protein